jgi:hypothetical protein
VEKKAAPNIPGVLYGREYKGFAGRGICKGMKTKGRADPMAGEDNLGESGYPHTPVIFVKADSKGLAGRMGVKADSKGVTVLMGVVGGR